MVAGAAAAAAGGSPGSQSARERNLLPSRGNCCSRKAGRAPPADDFSLVSNHLAQEAGADMGSIGGEGYLWHQDQHADQKVPRIRKYQGDLREEGGSHVVAGELINS